ncbi:MAG: hypothetical protein HC824_09890 [Synechococcales cyanobacterium RM1_1_8]|nr:hypothetical protein [Synechococcales cyanobacterium RM1_1_8]
MLNPNELLTPEESAQVDGALMTAKDRFSTRVAIYALRILKQVAAEGGLPIGAVAADDLQGFIARDAAAQARLAAQSMAMDDRFVQFWSNIIFSAQKPLGAIAATHQCSLASITTAQIIDWFEAQSKASLGS